MLNGEKRIKESEAGIAAATIWSLPCYHLQSIMNCKGRAEAFAKSLQSKLRYISRLTGDGDDDDEEEGERPSPSVTSVGSNARAPRDERTRLVSSGAGKRLLQQHNGDEFFDFDIGSPEEVEERLSALRRSGGAGPPVVTRQPGAAAGSAFGAETDDCESGCVSAMSSVMTEQDNNEVTDDVPDDSSGSDDDEGQWTPSPSFTWTPQPPGNSPVLERGRNRSPTADAELSGSEDDDFYALFTTAGRRPVPDSMPPAAVSSCATAHLKLGTIAEQNSMDDPSIESRHTVGLPQSPGLALNVVGDPADLRQGRASSEYQNSAHVVNTGAVAEKEEDRDNVVVSRRNKSNSPRPPSPSPPAAPYRHRPARLPLSPSPSPPDSDPTDAAAITEDGGSDPLIVMAVRNEEEEEEEEEEDNSVPATPASCLDNHLDHLLANNHLRNIFDTFDLDVPNHREPNDVVGCDAEVQVSDCERNGPERIIHGNPEDTQDDAEFVIQSDSNAIIRSEPNENAKCDPQSEIHNDRTDQDGIERDTNETEAIIRDSLLSARHPEVDVIVLAASDNVELDSPDPETMATVSTGSDRRLRVDVSVAVAGEQPLSPNSEDERPRRIRRCSSLKTGKTPPGTPHRKKIVSFADALGLDLADIRTIFLDDLPNVPKSAFDDLENADTAEQQQQQQQMHDIPPFGSAGPRQQQRCNLVPVFPQPASKSDFEERVRRQGVCLESATVSGSHSSAVRLVVRVANLDFGKAVAVRYTRDEWRTHAEVSADYAGPGPGASGGCDPSTDRFSTVMLLDRLEAGERLCLAVRYRVLDRELWDSNDGLNYIFHCYPDSVASSPLAPDDSWIHFL